MSHQASSSYGPALALVWCGALALFLSLPPQATAQGHVRINLTVVATDDNGNPIRQAQISIPRKGRNERGIQLSEITGETNSKGEFTRQADFELTGVAHKLRVTSGEMSAEEELSDQRLRDAFNGPDQKLSIPVSVIVRDRVGLTIVGTVEGENGQPIPSASVSIEGLGSGNRVNEFTGQDGTFKLANLVFQPGKEPERKIKISALNFIPVEEKITDDMLRGSVNGTLQLPVIRLSFSQTGSTWRELANVFNFGMWVLGLVFILLLLGYLSLLIYRRVKSADHGSRPLTIRQMLFSITASLGRIESNLETVKSSVVETQQRFLKHLESLDETKHQPGDVGGQQEPKVKGVETVAGAPPMTSERPLSPPPVVSDSRVNAKAAYENLVNKISLSPEPVYLVVEPPRSAGGKMEDRNTYLLELPHSNGSLVLIADGSNSGWIFPNPKIAFNTAAVKDVFKDLTEVEYETNKLGIEPMRAAKVAEGRWMLVVD